MGSTAWPFLYISFWWYPVPQVFTDGRCRPFLLEETKGKEWYRSDFELTTTGQSAFAKAAAECGARESVGSRAVRLFARGDMSIA